VLSVSSILREKTRSKDFKTALDKAKWLEQATTRAESEGTENAAFVVVLVIAIRVELERITSNQISDEALRKGQVDYVNVAMEKLLLLVNEVFK